MQKLRKKCEAQKLRVKNRALCDLTNQNQCLKEKNELSKVKFARVKDVNEELRMECIQLEHYNLDIQAEEESCHDSDTDVSQPIDFETTYYYSLLADQVPVSNSFEMLQSFRECE